MKAMRVAPALAVALALATSGAPAIQAQSIMRSPNINVGSRIPTITPSITPRINPNIAGAVTAVGRTPPNLRTYPACGSDARDSNGECLDGATTSYNGGGGGSGPTARKSGGDPRRTTIRTAVMTSTVVNELVGEIDSALTDAQVDELARQHGLLRIESRNFPLIGATIGRFRSNGRRALDAVRREFAADARVRLVQLNLRYLLQEQATEPVEGDPAQYALAKLRLPQAHTLARGANVTIAVVDSGIDAKHPELANSVADNFDALGSKEGPHVHGTGVAGAIVSHARLMGSAPAARMIAIRAFGRASGGAESNTFVVLKALDYAAAHGAQIVNMSFAGPKDGLIDRAIAALAARGIVMIAAAGNAGAKSPPLYPAANANVIAVSATDAQDRLFAASNRGSHIAIAAPGVDIFLPAPDQKYQVTSGTSFAAAYVSGLAALMLERNPALKRDELRDILLNTARDLGSPGRDDSFGAGEADALAAVQATLNTPLAAVPQPAKRESVSEQKDMPATRNLDASPAAVASDKSSVIEADQPARQ